ncbi:MAG: hypothetical protein HY519_00480 [Candidatus Aenigmarchaeota archaeon]|nr:hypothetical protein [Candidatus Aenigmarchaeota archaeon]
MSSKQSSFSMRYIAGIVFMFLAIVVGTVAMFGQTHPMNVEWLLESVAGNEASYVLKITNYSADGRLLSKDVRITYCLGYVRGGRESCQWEEYETWKITGLVPSQSATKNIPMPLGEFDFITLRAEVVKATMMEGYKLAEITYYRRTETINR